MCCEKALAGSGDGCVGLGRLQRNLVAQVLQAADKTALNTLATAFVEVIDTEVLIDLVFTAEQVVDDDEERVPEGDGGFLLIPAGGQATVLSCQVRTSAAAQ